LKTTSTGFRRKRKARICSSFRNKGGLSLPGNEDRISLIKKGSRNGSQCSSYSSAQWGKKACKRENYKAKLVVN